MSLPACRTAHTAACVVCSSNPRSIDSSSVSGGTGLMEMISQQPQQSYGVSEAATNTIVRRIHFQNTAVTAVPFHAGTPHRGSALLVRTHTPLNLSLCPLHVRVCCRAVQAEFRQMTATRAL